MDEVQLLPGTTEVSGTLISARRTDLYFLVRSNNRFQLLQFGTDNFSGGPDERVPNIANRVYSEPINV